MKRGSITKETNEIQRVLALRNSRNKRPRYKEFLIEGTTAIVTEANTTKHKKDLVLGKDIVKIGVQKDNLDVIMPFLKKHGLDQKITVIDILSTPENIMVLHNPIVSTTNQAMISFSQGHVATTPQNQEASSPTKKKDSPQSKDQCYKPETKILCRHNYNA